MADQEADMEPQVIIVHDISSSILSMDRNATVYMDTLCQITTNRSLASQGFEGYFTTSTQVNFRYSITDSA